MDWLAFVGSLVRRVPFERFLIPSVDNTRNIKEYIKTLQVSDSERQALVAENKPAVETRPEDVAFSGSTGVVTREGVDEERLAWQDGIIRGELWLLEGHLKNNCLGCGGDVECCWKHSQNILDAARETQSMTTEPLYRDTVSLIESIKPYVIPDDIRAGKYMTFYPPMSIKVSQIRTQFDKRVMSQSRAPLTLEEAKKLAAEEAAKEVERKWQSPEKK